MSRYETDDEQLEAIKNWWQKNGNQLLSGVLIAVLAWSGWTYYHSSKVSKATSASSTFEMLQVAMQQGRFSEVAREGLKLIEEQPNSPYAVGVALMEAKYHVNKNEMDQAKAQLNWVIDHAPDVSLKLVGQLRLVALEIDQKQFDSAAKVLSTIDPSKLKSAEKANVAFQTAELALAKGALSEARVEFKKVVDNHKADLNLINLAKLHLADLAE